MYGIGPDRRTCDEIHLNIADHWPCRLYLEDTVPDHSSLTHIWGHPEVHTWQSIFEKLIQLLRDNGFIKGERVMIDAGLVETDASIDSLQEREDIDYQARALRNCEKRCHDFRGGNKKRNVANHVSQTDEDVPLVDRSSMYGKLCYKANYAIEDKNGLMIDCQATTGAKHEHIVLPDRIDYLRGQRRTRVREIAADRGYGKGPTYGFLRDVFEHTFHCMMITQANDA